MINARETQALRRTLLKARGELLFAADKAREWQDCREPAQDDDRAMAAHEEYVSLRLSSITLQRLRSIDDALRRIQMGEYGICLECGETISLKRLKAVPWTEFCVSCQEQRAAGEETAAVVEQQLLAPAVRDESAGADPEV